jgi:hypothetical protein
MSEVGNEPVYAPRMGKILRFAVTSTAAATALGVVAGMGWIRVKARGTRVQFYFSTVDTGSVAMDSTTEATTGWELLDGQAEDYYITNETYIEWDADGAGFIEIMRAGRERTRGNSL